MTRPYRVPRYLLAAGRPHRAYERRAIVTGGPGLRLRFYPGVREDVREALKGFARWLRGELDLRHPVRVTVVPQATVVGVGGAPGWAAFLIPASDYVPGDVLRIVVGAGHVDLLETRHGYAPDAARASVLQDLAHELVHYEQWRDGRPIDERNVNRRARSLTRRYLATVPGPAATLRPEAPRPRRRRSEGRASGTRARPP